MTRTALPPFALCSLLALTAAAPAAAPAWAVDAHGSRLRFVATMGGQAFTGQFRRWTASIRFDPKALAASRVQVVVDTGSATTADATRDEALPTADWFSVNAFPRATFTAARFVDGGGGRYQAIGTLSVRGVARPATLPFTLAIQGDRATMQGALVLDRRAFGVGQGQFATGDTVGVQVKVVVRVVATRAG